MHHTTQMVDPMNPLAAVPMRRDIVPGLEIDRQIGAGATAKVFLAFDPKDPTRRFAVKFLSTFLSYQEDAMARWRREAEMIIALDHPNIVKGYHWGLSEDRPYLVMEYLAGESLADRLRRLEKLPEEEVLAIAEAVLKGLTAAHARNMIHRDIKPANIIWLNDGTIKVTDFGLAKDLGDQTLTMTGAIVGTPIYISPEQATARDVGIQSDLYSLGVTLFHLAAGEPPFKELNTSLLLTKKITDDVPDVRHVAPEVSSTLAFLINRLTQRSLTERLANPVEALALLKQLQSGEMTISTFVPTAHAMGPRPLRPVKKEDFASDDLVLTTLAGDSAVEARPHYLDDNQVLFYEDDTSRECYILMSGSVDVLKSGRAIATINEQGAFIGEMSPLRGAPRSATVVARADTVLLVIPEEQFHEFFSRHPEVTLALARSLASRLDAMNQQLSQARERLANLNKHVQEMGTMLRHVR